MPYSNYSADRQVQIVEDQPEIQSFLRDLFVAKGIDCLPPLDTGEQAVSVIRECEPAVVVLDIELAGELSGVDVAKQLGGICPSLIVFLTGHTDPQVIRNAQSTHPVALLRKPLQETESLVRIVQAAFRYRECLRLGPISVAEPEDLITVCAWCSRIRKPDREWISLSSYFVENPVRGFTHGICPECSKEQLRDMGLENSAC